MMTLQNRLLLFAMVIAAIVTGCSNSNTTASKESSHKDSNSVTLLPAKRTALNTYVELQEVYRSAEGLIWIECQFTQLKKDPYGVIITRPSVEPKPNEVSGVRQQGVAGWSVLATSVCNLPSSTRNLTISQKVIWHDIESFNLKSVSSNNLPTTNRGDHYIEVRDFRIGLSDTSDPRSRRRLEVSVKTNPGYVPYEMEIQDERGRKMREKVLAYSHSVGSPTDATFGFTLTPRQRIPTKVSIIVCVSHEKSATVRFENVPIAPRKLIPITTAPKK